jgi:hypothetical protein
VTIVFTLQQNFVFHPFGTLWSTHSVVSGVFHKFDVKVYAVLLWRCPRGIWFFLGEQIFISPSLSCNKCIQSIVKYFSILSSFTTATLAS